MLTHAIFKSISIITILLVQQAFYRAIPQQMLKTAVVLQSYVIVSLDSAVTLQAIVVQVVNKGLALLLLRMACPLLRLLRKISLMESSVKPCLVAQEMDFTVEQLFLRLQSHILGSVDDSRREIASFYAHVTHETGRKHNSMLHFICTLL